jgi:WD40 repeat protein
LASAGQEGDMHVWNLKERRRLHTLHGHSGAVWDLNYTPDGSRLVSAGHEPDRSPSRRCQAENAQPDRLARLFPRWPSVGLAPALRPCDLMGP